MFERLRVQIPSLKIEKEAVDSPYSKQIGKVFVIVFAWWNDGWGKCIFIKSWHNEIFQVLFKKELDKVYDPNAPEDDMREREEEMERMREHVFGESDLNKDRLISFEEFLAETKRDEFEKDPGKSM